MSDREKSPASESSSSATPPPIGDTASPDTTSPGGTANASGSGPTVPPAAPPGAFVMPPGMAMPPGMQFLPYFPQPATGGSGGGAESSDPNAPAQPQQMMIHPAFIPQMYSYPYPGMMTAGMKLKRRQVKNACTNCQKACKKCDDERPCPRCVKYGIADECQDSVRKERRKGIKRGSYKKKGLPGESEDGDATQQPAFMPYSAQLYSQWAAAAMSAAGAAGGKPGETPSYYPYFIAPVPQPGASGSGEASTSGEGQTATANAIAANPYFSQMYYGGYPPGYPVPPGYGAESSAVGSSKSAASNTVKSEEESEDELEEEEEEEPEESPKRKSSKKRRRGD